MTISGTELALQGDVLTNAIAFRGQSGQLVAEALSQVRQLVTDGHALYPPVTFPDARHPSVQSSLLIAPDSNLDGRLAQAEGVAFLVLLNESGALAANTFINFERTGQIQKIFGFDRNGWVSDAIDGFSNLGFLLGCAAGIRDRLLNDEGEPTGKTFGELNRLNFWRLFAKAIEDDDLTLGEKTVAVATAEAIRLADRNMHNNPEGARTPAEIEARINSFRAGVQMAAKLYLETRALAAKMVEEKIEPKRVNDL